MALFTKAATSRVEKGLRRKRTPRSEAGTSCGAEPETKAKGVPLS